MSNSANTMMSKILLLISILFIVSCETTSHKKKHKIIKEPKKEIIYTPSEELISEENKEEGVDNIMMPLKDFTGIEDFKFKNLHSLKIEYGDFNFSKLEINYEFHRYNANKCRIFIQNNTDDKKIIQITIFNLENRNIYKKYSKVNCE